MSTFDDAYAKAQEENIKAQEFNDNELWVM